MLPCLDLLKTFSCALKKNGIPVFYFFYSLILPILEFVITSNLNSQLVLRYLLIEYMDNCSVPPHTHAPFCLAFFIFLVSRCISWFANCQFIGTKQSWVCWLDWTDKAKANPCYWVSMYLCSMWALIKLLGFLRQFKSCKWSELFYLYFFNNVAVSKFVMLSFQLFFVIFIFEGIFIIGLQKDQSHWSTAYFTLESFTRYVKAKALFLRGSKLRKIHSRKRILVLPPAVVGVVDRVLQLQLLMRGLEVKSVKLRIRENRSNQLPRVRGIYPELVGQIKTTAMAWIIGV